MLNIWTKVLSRRLCIRTLLGKRKYKPCFHVTWIVTRKSLTAAYGDDDDKGNNDDGERFNKKKDSLSFFKVHFSLFLLL